MEPSRIMIHIPSRSLSSVCSKSIGSWHDRIPDETYACSFLSEAPAVWPLITQPASSICTKDWIVLGSCRVTLVHANTSPSPKTPSSFIAFASSFSVSVFTSPNLLSTGRPPGTMLKILMGSPVASLTNSRKPRYPATLTMSMGSENRDVVPRSSNRFANSDGVTSWSMCMCGSARPGVRCLPPKSMTRVPGAMVCDASVPTYAILWPATDTWIFFWISRV